MLPEGYPSRLWTLHGPVSSNILPSQFFFPGRPPSFLSYIAQYCQFISIGAEHSYAVRT